MTPAEASIRSLEGWGRCPDRSARTAPARAGLDARFEREARAQLGDHATDRAIADAAAAKRRAHYLRLSAAGVAARKQARGT